MTNFERWRYYTKDYESPDQFINWTFYVMISAALQRRVWWGEQEQNSKDIYPNQFVIFIGPPASGKTLAAGDAKALFKSFDGFDEKQRPKSLIKTGPSSVTLEGLTRYLHTNYTIVQYPASFGKKPGAVYTSSPLAFFIGNELGALIREKTHDLVVFLTEGWECGDYHRETKTQGIDMIKNMCITMLGAATPEWMHRTYSSQILGEGFSSRTIFVYGDKKRYLRDEIKYTEDQKREYNNIRSHIEQLTKLFGPVIVPPDVSGFLTDWYLKNSDKPVNNDKKLEHYYGRKKLHVKKLAMAVHFSESTSMTITMDACQRALKILAETELEMHKALHGGAKNNIANIAEAIKVFLDKNNGAFTPQKLVILEFFQHGTREEIDAALNFLQDTQQITAHNEHGVIGYIRTKD